MGDGRQLSIDRLLQSFWFSKFANSHLPSPTSHLFMTQLDLRGTPCPINFVRTKMKLEQMAAGELLEVWLDAGEPIEQVPDSLKMAGYGIEQIIEDGDFFKIQVRSKLA
jgi:TusA-related sulfurtransferase